MKHKNIQLKDVRITYDPFTGGISLISKDPAIKGKPFQVKLYSDTSSYSTLLDLLKSKGAYDTNALNIAERLNFHSAAETFVPNEDPRVHIRIGETFNGVPFDLNLLTCPHYLIGGGTGSGKSVLQRNIAAHALASDEIEFWGIDLKRVELRSYFPQGSKRLAVTLEEAFILTDRLMVELQDREKLLGIKGLNNYIDTTLKAKYLLIDEAWEIFSQEPTDSEEGKIREAKKVIIQERLKTIARVGRPFGFYLFLCSQRLDNELTGELKANLGGRILMGRLEPRLVEATFGKKPRYGGEFLRPRGRALIDIYGQQSLAQIAFMTQEAATL